MPEPELPLDSTLPTHVKALDGFRGVAILSVMLFHYVTACGFVTDVFVARKLTALCVFGWAGVDLFFVLSGFLITRILRKSRGGPSYFKNFYMRRTLRIFPLYYASLIVLFLILPVLLRQHVTPGVQRIYDAQGWMWAYAQDLGIVLHNEDFYDKDWLWVGHFWSLGVEEHFYLVWPVLVYWCRRRTLLFVAGLLMLLAPVLRLSLLALHVDNAAIYVFTLSRVDELALGGVIALLAERNSFQSMVRVARFAVVAAAVYVGGAVLLRRGPLSWDHWTALGPGFTALALGAGGLLVYALNPQGGLLRRAMENRALGWFGKLSYGAYIIHTPLQPLCLRLFSPQRLAQLSAGLGHVGSQLVGLFGFVTLGVGLTMLLAALSYRFFETPFLRLKRYFEPAT